MLSGSFTSTLLGTGDDKYFKHSSTEDCPGCEIVKQAAAMTDATGDGRMDGHGTYLYANGEAEVGSFKADAEVGEGVRWTRDRQTARRTMAGEVLEQITLDEAKVIAKRVGEPVPGAAAQ